MPSNLNLRSFYPKLLNSLSGILQGGTLLFKLGRSSSGPRVRLSLFGHRPDAEFESRLRDFLGGKFPGLAGQTTNRHDNYRIADA